MDVPLPIATHVPSHVPSHAPSHAPSHVPSHVPSRRTFLHATGCSPARGPPWPPNAWTNVLWPTPRDGLPWSSKSLQQVARLACRPAPALTFTENAVAQLECRIARVLAFTENATCSHGYPSAIVSFFFYLFIVVVVVVLSACVTVLKEQTCMHVGMQVCLFYVFALTNFPQHFFSPENFIFRTAISNTMTIYDHIWTPTALCP